MRPTVVWLLALVVSCKPATVRDAERKGDVAWLVQNGSPAAVAALGRLADEEEAARDALDKLADETAAKPTTGGASGLDVYLAAWGGVERRRDWGPKLIKKGLGERDKMNDAASAIRRGAPDLTAFIPELDRALLAGCDVRCGSALASASGPDVARLIASRLADTRTREAMCDGIGSEESSKDARAVFMRAPDGSRDALACPGAAARMAAHDDEALAWLAKTAEPGLLRATGSDVMPCDHLAKLWAMAFASRDHTQFTALSVPLGLGVKHCPKELDAQIAQALAADPDSQRLAVGALDTTDASIHQIPATCAALPPVVRSFSVPIVRARAQDALSACGQAALK